MRAGRSRKNRNRENRSSENFHTDHFSEDSLLTNAEDYARNIRKAQHSINRSWLQKTKRPQGNRTDQTGNPSSEIRGRGKTEMIDEAGRSSGIGDEAFKEGFEKGLQEGIENATLKARLLKGLKKFGTARKPAVRFQGEQERCRWPCCWQNGW